LAAWGEPSPPRPCPRRGKRERGESKSKFLAAAGNYLLAHAESALSPQPPNSLEPLEARHSQFLKRVKPASLGGTNGCTQSGPLMLNYPSKTDLHYIFLLTAGLSTEQRCDPSHRHHPDQAGKNERRLGQESRHNDWRTDWNNCGRLCCWDSRRFGERRNSRVPGNGVRGDSGWLLCRKRTRRASHINKNRA